MGLFKRLFGKQTRLTAEQFYFPYFYNDKKCSELMEPWGLVTDIAYNEKTRIPEALYLQRDGVTLLKIHARQQFMVDDSGDLLVWQTTDDKIQINKYKLEEGSGPQTLELDLSKLELGKSKLDNDLLLEHFVTYVRSDKVQYDNEYYDHYAILMIHENEVDLIPFDSFNEKGGDLGYVWPVLAQLDIDNRLLWVEGMRMEKFSVKLHK